MSVIAIQEHFFDVTEALNNTLFKLADFSVLIVFIPYYSPGTFVKEKENFLQLTRTTVDNSF